MRIFNFNGETYQGITICDRVFQKLGNPTKNIFTYRGRHFMALFHSNVWYCYLVDEE